MATTPSPVGTPTPDAQEIVAANIRALMGRNRVSQEALARVIGVSAPQLSLRLNGRVNLTVRELGVIARFFGKPMEELVTVGKHGRPELELVPSSGTAKRRDHHQPPLLNTVR